MHIFFADDSIQIGIRERMGKLIAFGGILFPEESIKPLSDKVDSIAREYGIPDGTEIKWSPPPSNWIHSNLHGDGRTECYRKILASAREAEGKAIVIVWDSGRTTLQGQEAFDNCVKYLFERLTTHLAKNDDYGIIVSDRPGGSQQEEKTFLSNFITRVQYGTEFVPPDQIILNILTTPSHLVRHLQIADLVTSITTAMVAGKYKYAKAVFEEVRSMLLQNHFNYVGGTGLKVFPDELLNIYHWILNEDDYVRVASATGWPLPRNSCPYCDDEFNC